MRKIICGLLTVCLAAALTGCEPNVPGNQGENNALNTNDTLGANNTGLPNGTGDIKDEVENGLNNGTDDENGLNNGTDDENGLNNGTDNENGLDHSRDNHENGNGLPNDENPAVENNSTAGLLLLSAFPAMNDFSHLPNRKIGWGLGREVDERNRPLDAIKANADFASLGGVFIGEREPVIYLTFDEGYENGCTESILNTLKAKSVKATFFVTYDYCKNSPELVQRMINEGHTVANHSYSHPSFPDCTVEQIREEIGKLHDYVKENFGGYEMNLIRFPMGEFSQRCLAVAQSMGYTSVFWSFAYLDWNVNNQPDPSASLEKIKAGTHPGAIVLLHAVSATNAAILGEAIDYWHGDGYSLGVIEVKESLTPTTASSQQL
jgi:peptidoglycan-N-acetylmuramic acid deacetylase